MTEATTEQADSAIVHATFRVTRHYSRTPARVFRAFADREQMRRWRVEGMASTLTSSLMISK
jgi:uncharacterized protein YndB with AHSA1/START domain